MASQTKGWKLRYWIILGYCVPIVLTALSSLFVFSCVQTVREKSVELQHSSEINQKVHDLETDVQARSRATRGYLLQKATASLEVYREAKKHLAETLNALHDLIQDPPQQKNLQQLTPLLQDLEELDQELFTLVDQGKTTQAVERWKMMNERERMGAISTVLETMVAREAEIVHAGEVAGQQALDQLLIAIVLTTILSIGIAIGLGTWIIRKIVQQINQSASVVASSTNEIAVSVEQQERTANQQAVSVSETTTTMDELGASARQSAEQAEAAAAGARQALAIADSGNQAVGRSIDGMAALKQKVGAIAEQILRLSEQTSQIGNISGLVSDLANQTNMLALNAAVEAVRAGEHGKGFAVVAGEIRKLADQSKKSAEKINLLVADIQTAINSTVMVTDEGTKTVEEGVKIAQQTAESFSGVTDAVNNVVLNSQQISLNVKQQAIAIQQVVDAMNALNVAAQETANGMGQVRIGTQQLNETASNLKAIV
ncbi:HAMP domain-containing methyl-accepting chemotaxis protein [Pantanalinema sp. GBBB05]|uniref:HAMP domain-containing methyl-accepting chemotaxis protein n=1 Tax=Pantanalinema sp. GBBB05 TaxID=2604139 RepID=UPI001D9A799C|nr:methyl-accepting chemotaxis protein [Pantanalinema sp. GBBB05]